MGVQIVYACISTHHLFDHKPDNLLKTGHKHQLNGFYKFGTPGVAVAWGDKDFVEDFMDTMNRAMPQKKFELVFQKPWSGETPTGWNEVLPPELKQQLSKLGVPDEDYFTILGLEMKATSEPSGGKNVKSKSKGKKKK